MRSVAVLLLLLLAAAVAVATDPVYERPYVAAFENSDLEGYQLMTLADIKDPSFVEYYNNRGVDFVRSFPEGSLCCVIKTADGYLAYGPAASNLSYLEPFQGSTDCCTTGTIPTKTTFGGGPISGEKMYYVPIPRLNATTLALLFATSTIPSLDTQCNVNGSAKTAYFKLKPPPPPSGGFEYKLQQIGPDYPPLSSGWTQASLGDVQRPDFATFYNKAGGLKLLQNETVNYCCMIQVSEGGWLMYGGSPGRSPLSTFNTASGGWDCSTYNTTIELYTTFGGNYENIFFPQWNASVAAKLSLLYNDTVNDFDGCIGLNDTLALVKKPSNAQTYRYKIQQVGPNYPAPAGWSMASLADVTSADFVAFYNANGVELTQVEATNYCCMVKVSDGGWIMYGATPGRSPLSTFNTQGVWAPNVVNERLQFGGYFGGNYNQVMLPVWNASVAAQLSLLTTGSKDFDSCGNLPNTLALWRQPL